MGGFSRSATVSLAPSPLNRSEPVNKALTAVVLNSSPVEESAFGHRDALVSSLLALGLRSLKSSKPGSSALSHGRSDGQPSTSELAPRAANSSALPCAAAMKGSESPE
jgi:hypothetical protein